MITDLMTFNNLAVLIAAAGVSVVVFWLATDED